MASKSLLYTDYAVSTGASAEVRTRTIVSMDDTPSALVKFLETYDQALGLSEFGIYEELPNFRQQRPIIVYNPSGREMNYDIDFLSYEMKEDRSDPQAALDTAYYFNYTRMALDLNGGNLADSNVNANDVYDLPEGILAGQWGGDSIQPLGADVNLIAGEYKNNLANDIASITPKAFAADPTAVGDLMTIAPHSVHIYMVDMGIPYTAGNSYQDSDLTIDVVMTTQQLGDTIHKIKTVADLEDALAAITDADLINGRSGDTIMLMSDIDVTEDITVYEGDGTTVKPGIFNLVLNGYSLSFLNDGASEGYLKVRFPDEQASGNTTLTMDVGSADGGEIINANRLMIAGNDNPNTQCVVNWYTDICKRITATGSPAEEIKFTMDATGYYIEDTANNVVNIAAQPSNLTNATLGASSIIASGKTVDGTDVPVTVVQRTTAGYITSRYTEWDNIKTELTANPAALGDLFKAADGTSPSGADKDNAFVIDSKEDFKLFVEMMNGKTLTDGNPAATVSPNAFFKVSSRIGEIKHFAPITNTATNVTLLFDDNASLTDIDIDGAAAVVFPTNVTLGRLVVDPDHAGNTKVENLTKDKVETDGSITAMGTYQIYLGHFTCTDPADALSTKDMTVDDYAPGIAAAN